jgi:hypothetical protein
MLSNDYIHDPETSIDIVSGPLERLFGLCCVDQSECKGFIAAENWTMCHSVRSKSVVGPWRRIDWLYG